MGARMRLLAVAGPAAPPLATGVRAGKAVAVSVLAGELLTGIVRVWAATALSAGRARGVAALGT